MLPVEPNTTMFFAREVMAARKEEGMSLAGKTNAKAPARR
jgi:hypothetical protein